MASIRAAKPQDVPALCALGREMHAEGWYAFMPFDSERLGELFHRLIADEQRGFLWLHETDGAIDATLAGAVAQSWFGPGLVAFEFGLFVTPWARGKSSGPHLVREFVRWARAAGAIEITLGVSTGVMIEATGQLYQRLGFSHVGGIYKMRA